MTEPYRAVTVTIPCYNQARYLGEAIESVLAQTFQYFELLLINDGSTDDTLSVMRQYAKEDARIRMLDLKKAPNVGVVLNRSIREARGDFWVWCPADDLLLPELLEQKLRLSNIFEHKAVIYDDFDMIGAEGNVRKHVKIKHLEPEQFAQVIWQRCPLGFTGAWIPLEIFDAVGVFPTHLSFSEDFYWIVRATIHGVPFVHEPTVLHKKRLHRNRTTARNEGRLSRNMRRIWEELSGYRKLYNEHVDFRKLQNSLLVS